MIILNIYTTPIYIYNIYIYIDYILYEFKPLNITKSQNVFMYKKNVSSSLLITVSSLWFSGTISKLIVRPSRRRVVPLPPPTTLPVLTFAFSFLMWIGSEISTTTVDGPQPMCVPESSALLPSSTEQGAGRLAKSEYVNICITCEDVLSIISIKNAPAVGGLRRKGKNGIPSISLGVRYARLGPGTRAVCLWQFQGTGDVLLILGKTFAIKAVAESGESACKVCVGGGYGYGMGWGRGLGLFFFSDFSTVACRRGVTQAVCLFALLIAYPCPLPPAPCPLHTLANYQHLVYLAYTPGRRHNELSRLSGALYTAPSPPQLISSCL